MLRVNDTKSQMDAVLKNLATAVSCCPDTWLQTCWFALDGAAPGKQDEDDYLDLLSSCLHRGISLQGVLLYGLARPSQQAEAPRLSALSGQQMEAFAARIRAAGFAVKVAL